MNVNILLLFITNVNLKKWKKKIHNKKKKSLCFVFPHSCPPLYFLSHSHSQCDCHENELLICFPKEFLMPRRPDSRNTMVVVWSTNNFPGLHCLWKALFHLALIMWKMSLSKGSSAFLLTQRCQMERVRISKHVNPRERKLSPFLQQCLRVHSACWKFPVLEQHKCAFELQDAICP